MLVVVGYERAHTHILAPYLYTYNTVDADIFRVTVENASMLRSVFGISTK